MKLKKKISKIYDYISKKEPIDGYLGKEQSYNNSNFSESNDDIKKKSRNLLFRLLSFKDRLNLNINNNTIGISVHLDDLNPNTNQGTKGNKYIDDNYLSIEIIKNIGYILSFRNMRVAFKYESIYEDTINEIRVVFSEINTNNFNYLYSSIMKESGMARESNLDDLLGHL